MVAYYFAAHSRPYGSIPFAVHVPVLLSNLNMQLSHNISLVGAIGMGAQTGNHCLFIDRSGFLDWI
jgi:hypothetical protein